VRRTGVLGFALLLGSWMVEAEIEMGLWLLLSAGAFLSIIIFAISRRREEVSELFKREGRREE